MAITAGFRPAQHTYQSTYEPFPFEQIAPIAMRMQQEYTAGIGAAGELESFVGGLPMAKADAGKGELKMEEAKEKVRGVLQSTPDARSPEFHMNLKKAESDIKNDPFWKITAANSVKEKEWESAINNPNITDANKWALMTKYAKYQDVGAEGGLLGDATTAKYVDYNTRLETMAEGYLPTGWQTSLENNEFTQSGGQKGIDPARVASGLGLVLKGNRLEFGTIPSWFTGTEEGAQLERDARYQYDMIRIQDPETEHTLESIKNAIYYDTAAKLVEKYSGYVTSTAEGLGAGDAYTGLSFSSYMDELATLQGTPAARKAANAYKKGNVMAVWEKLKDLPGFDFSTDKVENFLALAKEANIPLDDIREQLDIHRASIAMSVSAIPTGGAGTTLGTGIGFAVANALLVPFDYSIQEEAPTLSSLSNDERNAMWRVIKEKGLETKFYEDGLTNEIWQGMQEASTNFFEQGVFVDVGMPAMNESTQAKHTAQTTERLFGIGADKGKIRVGEGGNVPGKLSQHIIIDKNSGELLKVENLDLPVDEEIVVEYKGILDARNPYGPQTIAVHIDGKEYYVIGQNPTRAQVLAHSLNSYQFTYNGVGAEFNTGDTDADGQPVTLKPIQNFNTGLFELEASNGITYTSEASVEDAYLKYVKDIK